MRHINDLIFANARELTDRKIEDDVATWQANDPEYTSAMEEMIATDPRPSLEDELASVSWMDREQAEMEEGWLKDKREYREYKP